MRAVVRCVLAVIVIAATVVVGPARVSRAAATQSERFAVTSVLPTRGDVVGVAHPVVVTFSAPVANRDAAERAIDIKTTPAMRSPSNVSSLIRSKRCSGTAWSYLSRIRQRLNCSQS
jgi:lipoprotein-anchoring transpeptidase ErfK/SrfK